MKSVFGRILLIPVAVFFLLSLLFYLRYVEHGPVPFQDFILLLAATALLLAILSFLLTYRTTVLIIRPLQNVVRLLKEAPEVIREADFTQSGIHEINEIQNQAKIYLGRMREQLAELDLERELFRSLLNGLREGVICVDSAGNIVFANNRIDERLLDSKPQSLRYYSRIRNPVLLEYIRRLISGPLYSGEAKIADAVFTDDGDLEFRAGDRYFRLRHRPVQIGSEPSMFLILIQDMTEEYNTRRMREDFLQNASHELKTPITSIRGYAETLLPRIHEETPRRFLEGILRNAERMNRLIHDMVVISSLESRAYPFQPETIDISSFFDELKLLVEGILNQKQQRLNIEVAGVRHVYADRLLLEHLLVNLVSNASRYSPEDSSIAISVKRNGNGRIELRVSDQGPGIPEAYREKIFERFFRVDTDRSRKEGGTGLGLSIARHVARIHSGTIHVEDASGGGACFVFAFPGDGP
jgi:two-component system phosphate regulon sensor histidine kinase PhoR